MPLQWLIFNPTVFRLTEKGKEFLEDQLLSSLTPFTIVLRGMGKGL